METAATSLPFPAHARQVVHSVRGALSELVASLGANPQDPQSIGQRFGLNKNLAWKIAKIVQSDDPSLALQQMPGAPGIRIFLRSVERAGASAALLRSTRDAIDEYEQLIRIHSGDRATLEMMGSELGPAGREQRDEYFRKMYFQGASYVWGAHARVTLKVGIAGPGAKVGVLDFASLSGMIDFRRFRHDVTWTMAVRRWRNDDGSVFTLPPPEAIDPAYNDEKEAPLMPEFCSQPLPKLIRVVGERYTSFELPGGPVGNTGTQTCVIGTIQRGLPYYREPSNDIGEHVAVCDTPAELFILDLYVHKTFTFAIPPEASLHSDLGSSEPYPLRGRERFRLPLNEPLQDLGSGSALPATPEVRRYSEMVRALFERMGWKPTEFHGFRIKVPYPACSTSLVLSYPLPPAPA